MAPEEIEMARVVAGAHDPKSFAAIVK